MARLTGKNILIIIPKDYYNEQELDFLTHKFKEEEAKVYLASSKLKEAVGMKNGRVKPDLLIVDSMEGITGDSYVTGGTGTRQIKGIFHGVVIIGGKGAKSYLWKDNLVRLLILDRHRSGFVVSAIGSAVPCLANAGLIDNIEVAAEENKYTLKAMEEAKVMISDDEVTCLDRVITGKGASAVEPFAQAVIEAVEKTPHK
ncbi:MAG: DJ-1/PfpI family protein [Nitrospinaceae bacterium]